MKYIKKFESEEFDEEFEEIKSILRDLKDEYTYIEGQILIVGIKNNIQIIIECENIFNENLKSKKGTVEYSKFKLKFIESLLIIIQRLESSLGKASHTTNLWDFDHWVDTNIKIFFY
jgi:hypothetical protein